MGDPLNFDVLVIGSGASGLAAAVSAERSGARVALTTKGSLQSCNSAKAQGGIQAAFGEDDSPEQHAEDVWQSSHETADRRLVEVLTGEAPGAIHWLEELGVEFTRENGGYRLARCGGGHPQAALAGRRPDGACDHARPSEGTRGLERQHVSEVAADEPRANRERLAGALRRAPDRSRHRRSRCRGRCFKEAQERGELSTNHPARQVRRPRSRSRSERRRAISTRSSTTRTGALGRPTCRATRFRRRRARTARPF